MDKQRYYHTFGSTGDGIGWKTFLESNLARGIRNLKTLQLFNIFLL